MRINIYSTSLSHRAVAYVCKSGSVRDMVGVRAQDHRYFIPYVRVLFPKADGSTRLSDAVICLFGNLALIKGKCD